MRKDEAIRVLFQGASDHGGGNLSARKGDVHVPIKVHGIDGSQNADELGTSRLSACLKNDKHFLTHGRVLYQILSVPPFAFSVIKHIFLLETTCQYLVFRGR